MPLGAHLPTSKGFEAALRHACELGCDCLQIFSKSPRQWDAAPLDVARAQAFRDAWKQSGFFPLVAHDSYLINLAAPDDAIRECSIAAMIDEVSRADALGCDFLVTHCGAHGCKEPKSKAKPDQSQGAFFSTPDEEPMLTVGESAGLQRLTESLRRVLEATPQARVRIALENTAAQGTCLGGPFEHLSFVLDELQSDRLCVCFDTCHAFAAGHDIATIEGLEATLRDFDATIGLKHLALIHFNDSKGDLGGHLDRHEHIGKGKIGREGMRRIVHHPLLKQLPFILETPELETMIGANLDAVRELRKDETGMKSEKRRPAAT